MDYLIDLIRWIGVIASMVCLLILFGPIFAWFYQIDREARSADYVIELFTYPLEEPPTDYIDVAFTVITEDQ
ncbi:MAG: hypothetical protein KDE01_32075, partial [Caldilineaceae bacterium]|nr:hypothetical protein [Caldilinea sp.]MCB0152282.1 hypothetical protein [Caldilineaceae bacterium]MCB9117992.1 hypothetical protein [Caldilineaceae bacterium]MCB9125604.1 hypothetical protein [Caldilineaceae bacterium]